MTPERSGVVAAVVRDPKPACTAMLDDTVMPKKVPAPRKDLAAKEDLAPISATEAKRLFADWTAAPAIVLAVSGGPDSVALMWLAARWRRAQKHGPRLIAVTVDHGLRAEAAREARDVRR